MKNSLRIILLILVYSIMSVVFSEEVEISYARNNKNQRQTIASLCADKIMFNRDQRYEHDVGNMGLIYIYSFDGDIFYTHSLKIRDANDILTPITSYDQTENDPDFGGTRRILKNQSTTVGYFKGRITEDNTGPIIGTVNVTIGGRYSTQTSNEVSNAYENNEWISEQYITLKVSSVTDAGVGIGPYSWLKDQQELGNSPLDYITLSEGIHSLQFKAVDRFGNSSRIVKDIYIDNTAPSVPKPEFENFKYIEGDLHATFSWEPSDDTKSGVNSVSGVDYYVEHDNRTIEYDVDSEKYFCSIPVSFGEKSTFLVQAVDKAGNTSSYGSSSIYVPSALHIDEVIPSAYVDKTGPSAIYSNKIVLNLNLTQLLNNSIQANQQYMLYRNISNSAIGFESSYEVLDRLDFVLDKSINKYVYIDTIQGKEYAHSDVEYYIETNIASYYDQQFWVYNDSTTKEVANIPSHTSFIMVANSTGYDNTTWTNIFPEIELSETYSDVGYDIEGDDVEYRLKYSNESPGTSPVKEVVLDRTNSFPQIMFDTATDGFKADQSGIYEFYLKRTELIDENTKPSIPVEGETIPSSMIHTIKFDNANPSVLSFNIYEEVEEGADIDLSESVPTNNHEDIYFSITLSGNEHSGLERLDLYSGEVGDNPDLFSDSLFETLYFKTTYDLEDNEVVTVYEDADFTTPASGASLIIDEIVPDTYHLTITSIDLPFESDGDVTTKYRIVLHDRAGNISDISQSEKTVTVDLSNPTLTLGTTSYASGDLNNDGDTIDSGEDKFINFTWTAEEYSTTYVIYTDLNGVSQTVVPDISGTISLPVSGYNESKTITLNTYDIAGNETSTTMEGHSRAYIGNMTSGSFEKGVSITGDTLIETNINRWVKFKYNDVIATSVFVQQIDGDGNHIGSRISPDIDGYFTISGIGRRGTVNYKVIAVNGSSNETEEIMTSITLDNILPSFGDSQTVSPEDNGYVTSGNNISWISAIDTDLDTLTYKLNIYDEDGVLLTDKSQSGITNTFYSIDSLSLQDNTTYQWNVTVDDGIDDDINNLPDNDDILFDTHRSFKIDVTNPVINEINIAGSTGYINNTQLIFNVSDIETDEIHNSGVKEVEVSLNDNSTDFTTDYSSNSFNNNNSSTVKIDLPEGEVDVDITVTDNVNIETSSSNFTVYVDRTLPVMSDFTITEVDDANYFYTTDYLIPISFDIQDDFSGVSHLLYTFTETDSENVSSEDWNRKDINSLIPQTGDSVEYAISKELTFQNEDFGNGEDKYLRLRIYDHAGNFIEYNSSKPILVDTSSPIINIPEENIWSIYGGQKYLDDSDDLNGIDRDDYIYDNESGINISSEAIIEGTSQAESMESITNVETLTDGNEYSIVYYAKNNATDENISNILSFIYDSSNPTELSYTTNEPEERDYVRGETLTFDVSVREPHSPIVYSELIIRDENGNNITGSFTGNIDSTIQPNNSWTRSDPEDETLQLNRFSFTLPEDMENGTYQVTISCKNASDLSITGFSHEITVSDEFDVVTLAVPTYSKNKDRVYYDWSFSPANDTDVEVNSFSIQYKAEGDATWLDCDNNESYISLPLGLEFEEAKSYSFKIEAYLSNGYTIEGESGTTIIDTIEPNIINEVGKVLWPTYSESTKLYAYWNVQDSGTGVDSIKFKVRKKVNDTFVRVHDEEWIEINGFSSEGQHTFSSLGITTGDNVIISRQISDKAGNMVPNSSNFILIDDTPPVKPVVINSTPFINPAYARDYLSQRPKVDWIQSLGDSETDVTYSWAFVQSKENIESDTVTWYLGSENKTATITDDITFTFNDELHQETWYFAVKAENSLGLASYGFCDGVTFDKTAPSISDVRVLEVVDVQSISDGEIISKSYINNFNNMHLYIQAFDNESGINSYSGEYGTYVDGLFTSLSSASDFNTTNVDSIIKINNISSDLDSVVFRGTTENGTGTPEVGYSSTVLIDTEKPKITELLGINNNGKFTFSWNGIVGNSPIIDYEYRIEKDDTDFKDWTAIGSSIPILDIDTRSDDTFVDGNYIIYVRAVSESGLVSSTVDEIGISNALYLDATDPVLVKPEKPPVYVSQTFSYTLSASDSGSGIGEYQYRIGTITNPSLISGDWISIQNSDGTVDLDIDFDDYPTTYDGISDGEEIVIRAMVKDNAGNWSSELVSDVITIDKSPATVSDIEIPRYCRFTSSINNISYNIVDDESGVQTINYDLVKIEENSEETIFTTSRAVEGNIIEVTDETLKITGDTLLLNECNYKLKISAVNNTGDESSYVDSLDIVTVDTVKPVLTFTNYLTEEVVNESSEENKYSIEYTLSELCDVEFTLIRPDGTNVETSAESQNQTNNYGFHHLFANESLAYGNYTLVAVVHDRAGNDNRNELLVEKPYEQSIRFNRPPKITIYQTYVNPGRPITLSVNEQGNGTNDYYLATVVDDDGDYHVDDPFTYEWKFYNGNGPDNTEEIIIEGKDGTIPFYHSSNSARRTAYPYELKVTDNKGKSAVMTFSGISTNIPDTPEPLMFIVKNTWRGEFFVDEYWTSTDEDPHKIFGDINVGFNGADRLTLTVEEDTVVEVNSNILDSGDEIVETYEHGINVSGNIIVEDGSLFKVDDSTSSYWNGIVILNSGVGGFTGSTIQDAKRGITSLYNATLSIDRCTIEDNIIGLHVFDNSPTITNFTIFRNNIAYGIKEDGDSDPTYSSNTIFNNNTIDYYDSVNTVVSGENN